MDSYVSTSFDVYRRAKAILKLMNDNSWVEEEFYLGIYRHDSELEKLVKTKGYSFKVNGKGFATFKLIQNT